MSDAFVVVSSLSFSWPDDTPVFDGLSVSVPGGRTGLAAPNGAGKSTLLKLVAGALTPSGGSVSVEGVLGYLPQDLPLTAGLTVAEVLGVADVLRAIRAVESGDVAEEHFTTIGTDWDLAERTRAQLDRLGLGDLEFDRALGTLSGGQVISLGLAAQLLKQPHLLLLDEPTNHLSPTLCDELEDALAGSGSDRAREPRPVAATPLGGRRNQAVRIRWTGLGWWSGVLVVVFECVACGAALTVPLRQVARPDHEHYAWANSTSFTPSLLPPGTYAAQGDFLAGPGDARGLSWSDERPDGGC